MPYLHMNHTTIKEILDAVHKGKMEHMVHILVESVEFMLKSEALVYAHII